MRTFGSALRELREKYGLSQRQVGIRYGRLQGKDEGIAPSVVAGWESGLRNPSVEVIGLLAQAIGANHDEHDRLLMAAGFLPVYRKIEDADGEPKVSVRAAVEAFKRVAKKDKDLSDFSKKWVDRFVKELMESSDEEKGRK